MNLRLRRVLAAFAAAAIVAAIACEAAERVKESESRAVAASDDTEESATSAAVPDPSHGLFALGDAYCSACHPVDAATALWIGERKAPSLEGLRDRADAKFLRRWLDVSPPAHPPGAIPPHWLVSKPGDRVSGSTAAANFLVSFPAEPFIASNVVDPEDIDRGRDLYRAVGCVACHGTPDDATHASSTITRLPDLAKKTWIGPLTAFLRDPKSVQPQTRMPNPRLTDDEARAIAAFLLRDQIDRDEKNEVVPAQGAGLRYEIFSGTWSRLPDFSKLAPIEGGVAKEFGVPRSGDFFAMRLTGSIRAPWKATYRFFLRCDDGARLRIDGREIVANDGIHPPSEASGDVALESGRHAVEVEYFEHDGGEDLSLEWLVLNPETVKRASYHDAGPSPKRESVPAFLFTHSALGLGPSNFLRSNGSRSGVSRGRESYAAASCAACHPLPGIEPPPLARPLREVASHPERGCLSEESPARFGRSPIEPATRAKLAGALRTLRTRTTPPTPAEEVALRVERLGCVNCHERDGRGGVDPAVDPWFTTLGEAELGDEGRRPPSLTGVGRKLRGEWMERVIHDGASVRPYMATRMPSWKGQGVDDLASLLAKVDGATPEPDAPFSAELVDAGRKLTSAGSLACIQCHLFAGHASLGVPALDLATITPRVRREWFRDYLLDPASLRPGTRMPTFFPEGRSAAKSVLHGDANAQIDALWAYLSLGDAAPLPTGLRDVDQLELRPESEPIVFRTFLTGVGPRGIAVGFPEGIHAAYDADGARLARLWRGRFLNAGPAWSARAGQFASPLGRDALDLPAAPALAQLARADDPWPVVAGGRDPATHSLGYRLADGGRPVFLSRVGNVEIEEALVPTTRAGGASITRRFTLRFPENAAPITLRAFDASTIDARGGGRFAAKSLAGSSAELIVTGDGAPRVVAKTGGAELRVEIAPAREAHVEIEVRP